MGHIPSYCIVGFSERENYHKSLAIHENFTFEMFTINMLSLSALGYLFPWEKLE